MFVHIDRNLRQLYPEAEIQDSAFGCSYPIQGVPEAAPFQSCPVQKRQKIAHLPENQIHACLLPGLKTEWYTDREWMTPLKKGGQR